MDMINGAIDTLLASTGKEDWTPVILNVEDATVSVIKEKVVSHTHSRPFHLPPKKRGCTSKGAGKHFEPGDAREQTPGPLVNT